QPAHHPAHGRLDGGVHEHDHEQEAAEVGHPQVDTDLGVDEVAHHREGGQAGRQRAGEGDQLREVGYEAVSAHRVDHEQHRPHYQHRVDETEVHRRGV